MICNLLLFLFANYTSYTFEKKELVRSEARFRRYVVPQINGIILDFERFFSTVNILEEENNALTIFRETLNLKNCKEKCLPLIHKLSDSINKLENKLIYSPNVKEATYDQIILIDNLIFSMDTQLSRQRLMNTTNYSTSVLESLASSIALTSMPKNYQEHFQSVWHNFIVPLWINIYLPKNEDYLLDYLGDLNMAWNIFNRKIMRNVIPVNQTGMTLSDRIHSRWNSILKIYLRKA